VAKKLKERKVLKMKAVVQSQPDILKISLVARKSEWGALRDYLDSPNDPEIPTISIEAWFELIDQVLESGKREVSVFTERETE